MYVAQDIATNGVDEAAVALQERGERSLVAMGGKLLQQPAIAELRVGFGEFAERLENSIR